MTLPSILDKPLNNGHFFGVPRVAIVHRFDCILKNQFFCSFYLGTHLNHSLLLCWRTPEFKTSKIIPSQIIKKTSILCGKMHTPCDLCAYFRNPQGQTISSWILVYLCVWPKKILVYVIGIFQLLIQKNLPFPRIENLSKIIHFE